jgi:DNA topoisomerase I
MPEMGYRERDLTKPLRRTPTASPMQRNRLRTGDLGHIASVSRLHKVDPTSPGIARRRRGSGFSYEDARGRAIRDPDVLERISDLAVPPAWTDVWICPDPDGHLQALGTDAAGRRQPIYHEAWRRRQDSRKFRRVESFARALPDMRPIVERDLALDGVPKERVMAGATRLLDRGTFRIGSESYADINGSFGLATMRKSHVQIEGSRILFDYVAKGGARRRHEIEDPVLVPLLEQLKRRRSGGIELLAYREQRRWRNLRSAEINTYIKLLLGEEHSAKDFRTWHATVLAAVDIAGSREEQGVTSQKRAIAATIRNVAEHLGNTPAVARTSYIDPRVFERFRSGRTVAPALADIGATAEPEEALELVERAVLDLLGADPSMVAA